MRVNIEFAANEIEHVPEMSCYNYIVWKFTNNNRIGITHFIEKYDDVNDWPYYHFGIIEDGQFKYIFGGEGDSVPLDSLGCGGVFTSVYINYPENLLGAKK